MEVKKNPAIQECRDKPMANPAELAEILEGFQATGRRVIYPSIPNSISTDLDKQTEDEAPLSYHATSNTSSHLSKKQKGYDGGAVKRLGCVHQRPETATERLLQVVETVTILSSPGDTCSR